MAESTTAVISRLSMLRSQSAGAAVAMRGDEGEGCFVKQIVGAPPLVSIPEEMMKTRSVLLSCLIIASACIWVGQEPDVWKTVELVAVDDLIVRLRVKSSASLADAKWIVIEFENSGEKAVAIEDATYRLESRGIDVASGDLQYSGGLGQGHTVDLFGSKSSAITIEPGTTEVWKHPSDYASALVSRQKQAVTVRVDVYFSLTLQDRRRFSFKPRTDGEGDVSFTWHKLDDADVERARSRLKDLLHNPPPHHAAGYAIGALLKVPEVATAFSAQELVSILPLHLKDAFSGRDPILEHLNQHANEDAAVLDFVKRTIEQANQPVPTGKRLGDVVNSNDVKTLLVKLPNVWRDDYLEGLLLLYKKDANLRDIVLRRLTQQGLLETEDQILARRLSSVFYESGEVAALKDQLIRSPRTIQMLGQTRDRRLVTELAPLLRDRREFERTGAAPQMPSRVCDTAMSAILNILGDEVDRKQIWSGTHRFGQFFDTRDNGDAPFQQSSQSDIHYKQNDKAILRLEAWLRGKPEFAGAIRPVMELPKDLQKITERWQQDRLPEDFFRLTDSIETGMAADQVRDILGSPLKVEREGNRARRLYLEPQFRFSLGDSHWLRFDEADKVIKWDVDPWNKLYDPASVPPVTRWTFGEQESHGVWDDIFAIEERDIVIARRGPEWWKFTVPELKLEKIGDFPDLKRVRVRRSIDAGAPLWLLCDSPDVAPFALEINSGKRVVFTVDGADLPASIQSHIVVPTHTAILMISGGDRKKWPRDGNRSIYHWMDLNTGASRQLPIGWDLRSFTSDQRLAVGSNKLAIDMRTGNSVVTKSDAVKNAVHSSGERIEYDWGNTALAQPLSNRQRDLIGFSVGGKAYRFIKPYSNPHLPEFATRDKRVAFHLRRHGDETRPSCLWTAAIGPVIDPVLISDNVYDWRLLSGDHCVLGSTITPPPVGEQNEAFVYDARTGKMWNILDDVAGLPQGASHVHFRSCFGDPGNGRLVLCDATGTAGSSIHDGHWKRWVIVNSADRRYIVEEFPPDLFADASRTWLHNSGTLLISTYKQDSRVNPPLIQFELSTAKLTGK